MPRAAVHTGNRHAGHVRVGPERYCFAIATRSRSSGEIKWF